MMRVIDSGLNSAEFNMQMDEKLLFDLDPKGEPILHFYEWEGPCATYGYFIDPAKHLDLAKAKIHGLGLARRPTGGGIVFHIWDLAFSFLMPSSHEKFSLTTLANYRFVNQAVLEVVRDFLELKNFGSLGLAQQEIGGGCRYFCMAKPTVYDVMYEGRKIAGAAQRRRKNGYLHQGTISLVLPQEDLLREVLLSEGDVLEAMMAYSFAPLGSSCSTGDLEGARKEIARCLSENLRAKL